LLDAAFDLLGTEGWAGTSVRAVCAAARLNPRYFYESFDDLDALVVAVYDRVVAELAAAVAEAQAAAPADPASQAHASIDCILRFVDDDRRRGRVLYVEAIGNEALNRRRRETGLRLVELVERDAASRGHLPAGEHIGRVGAALLVGGFSEVIEEWLEGRIDVSRDQLAADAAALCLALAAQGARIAQRRPAQPRG
jgi:AcrR family transcriptional regulator